MTNGEGVPDINGTDDGPSSAGSISTLGVYVAAVVMFGSGWRIWTDVRSLHLLAVIAGLACALLGVALLLFGSLGTVSPARKRSAATAGYLSAFAIYAFSVAQFGPPSSIPARVTLSVYAAQLTAGGANPYAQPIRSPLGRRFEPIEPGVFAAKGSGLWTYPYPALSFLLYVPATVFPLGSAWPGIAAYLALIAILALAIPRPLNAVAPALLFIAPWPLPTLPSDGVWAALVTLSALWWRRSPVTSAVFLGLACSIDQLPWIVVPFALIDWCTRARERRDWRQLVEPLCALAVFFLAPNLRFIVLDWHHWATGVLSPIAALAGPDSTHTRSLVAAALLLALLVFYATDKRRLGFVPFIVPAVVVTLLGGFAADELVLWLSVFTVYQFSPHIPAEGGQAVLGLRRFPARAALGGALAVLLVGLTFLGAHSANHSVLGVAIADYGYDPRTGKVDSFLVRVANATDEAASDVRFGIRPDGARLAVWNGALQRIGAWQQRDVRIVAPRAGAELEPSGTIVRAVALATEPSTRAYSEPRAVLPAAAGLANPQLTKWRAEAPPLPAAWKYYVPHFTAGFIRRFRDGNGYALAFDASSPQAQEWRILWMLQEVRAPLRAFSVRLRPYFNYRAAAYPSALFALEIFDAVGHHAYYTIDASLAKPRVFKHDLFTVFVLPGQLGRWNTIDVDPNDLASIAGLAVSKGARVWIEIVTAKHRGQSAPVRGDFGGIANAALRSSEDGQGD